jgi:hypothetical protein
MIEGKAVTLFVDHKPLVSAYKSQNPAKSDRQQRQLSVIAEYVSKSPDFPLYVLLVKLRCVLPVKLW